MKSIDCAISESSNLIQLEQQKRPVRENKKAIKTTFGLTAFGTKCAFLKNGACSKALMNIVDNEFEHPLDLEESASTPLAGGLMHGYQCGMLWGTSLAAGAQAYRLHGPGPRAEALTIRAAQRLVESFRAQNDHLDCLELTETDPRDKWRTTVHFFIKGGIVSCLRRAAEYAPEAFTEINTTLSEQSYAAPCNSTNCAATLARKIGASEMQTVMAAGLSGGIGFSGGACGALGAAIWVIGIIGRNNGSSEKAIRFRISNTIDRFLKYTGYEFECSKIVDRKFKDIDDHARYLSDGGCSKIIELIALEANRNG